MFVLVVHITLAFAQEQVGITIVKDVIETDLNRIDLFLDENTEPFDSIPVVDPALPLRKNVTITTINGKATVSAVAVDDAGNKGNKFSKEYDLIPGDINDIIYSEPFAE